MLISSDNKLSFEKSRAGRKGVSLPKDRFCENPPLNNIPTSLKRQKPILFPELSEPEVVRHFVNLSRKNFSIDTHFYPLGSCTMKYNPKVNDWAANLEKFTGLHPLQNISTAQGILQIFHELEYDLKEISGMDKFSLQPAAGAHGELVGMMIVKAYHEKRGDFKRKKVLVPDSSHGTNPASASLYGYHVIEIKSNASGCIDLEDLDKHLDDEVACLMLTNPNTLGLFENNILEVTAKVHESGGLLYYDGANLNALLGIARPGDMGFDIMHINLHKTFSTPHGGGGPGSGPVGVKSYLSKYLPGPLVEKSGREYIWSSKDKESIGRVKSFHGNVGVLIRAFIYIKILGLEGLKKTSEDAILNANYLKEHLKDYFDISHNVYCMHEFVISLKSATAKGIHAGDVGKRLLDLGIHAPTVHFPLVVSEALMIEPTETESKETLDSFIKIMKQIASEISNDPEIILTAPRNLPIRRPNEVLAARKPILTYRDQLCEEKNLSDVRS